MNQFIRPLTMRQRFAAVLEKMLQKSDPELYSVTTPENVYQPAHKKNRRYYQYMMGKLLLEGSGVRGFDNLAHLHDLARQGHSALVLSAHYTNYDVGAFYALMQREGLKGREIFDDTVFIAGRKLTEGDKIVKAQSEVFNRLVISAKSSKMSPDEITKAMAINKASQKALSRLKHEGKIFYLYPTGTRVRVGKPQTYSGMREIYNYVNKFDYFICCGISGIILPATDDSDMLAEFPQEDVVVYRFGQVYETRKYLKDLEPRWKDENEEFDKKQFVIDTIMQEIYSLGQKPEDLERS